MGFINSYFKERREKALCTAINNKFIVLKKIRLYASEAEKMKIIQEILDFRKHDSIKKANDDAMEELLNMLNTYDGDFRYESELSIGLINSIEMFKDDRIDRTLLAVLKTHSHLKARERAAQALDKRGWKPISLEDIIYYYLAKGDEYIDKLKPINHGGIECLLSILEERCKPPIIYMRAAQLLSEFGNKEVADKIYACAVLNHAPSLGTVLKKLKWQPIFHIWCLVCTKQPIGKIEGMGVGLEGGNIQCPSCGEKYSYIISKDKKYLYVLNMSRITVSKNQPGKDQWTFKPPPFIPSWQIIT